MGGVNSTEVPKRTNKCEGFHSTTDHFFINLRAPNLLHVVDAPRDIVQQLITYLGLSAKSVRPVWRPNTYEIEIIGSPFFEEPDGIEEKGSSIEISFCRFLSALEHQNWRLYTTLNLSPFCDRSSCYFRKTLSHTPIISADCEGEPMNGVVSVTFRTPFTIAIASNIDQCLDGICDLIKSASAIAFQSYQLDPKECTLEEATEGSRILKAPFNLWKCVSLPHSVLNRKFLLELVMQLENFGYHLSTCVNFRGKSDSLFFMKRPLERKVEAYCLLSAHQWDILRLYEAPKDLIDVTRLVVNQHWAPGFESECSHLNWHEFHLTAFPWAARAADAGQSRSMMSYLLQTYLARGWRPVANVQLSRTFKDRSCIVLRRENPSYRPHMCLGLLDSNELHLINAEEDLRDYLVHAVSSQLIVTRKFTKGTSKGGWPLLTLRGAPWCNESLASYQTNYENGNRDHKTKPYDFLEARDLIQKLLIALRLRGWEPVASVDLAARVRYRKKLSNGSISTKPSSTMGKVSNSTGASVEDSIPLDVNSLILANVNGSRHNSFARSANDPPLLFIRSQMSVD